MTSWDLLTDRSILTCPTGGWKPTRIAEAIEAILDGSATPVRRTAVGESFLGRPIEMLNVGGGPKRMLLWSQMHGDEPTHTTVLLNLLRLLVDADIDSARTLLAGATIGMIMPLNPDGAERNSRFNAQGIDINRDALVFATPEGRALSRAIEEFDPHYGFNLHNQHHRTAIGTPPAPAAVSLLVPPIDEENTPTDATREAVRVAAFFCECVRGPCEGRVSRYEVEYMSRAFGEWVQRRGVATVLVEAGGWPGGDFVVLERLHLAALVQTLEAIVDDRLGEADARSYHDLQRSSDYHLFDLLVQPGAVVQSANGHAYGDATRAEVGVDFPHRKAGWYEFRDGVIRSIGDLHENGGLAHHRYADACVAPGRIVLAPAADDVAGRRLADWDALTAKGVTTALASIDLSADDFENRLNACLETPPPINAALVASWSGSPSDRATLFDRLTLAAAAGVAAVVAERPSDDLLDACRRLRVPIFDPSIAPNIGDPAPTTLGAWLDQARSVAERLGWTNRGRIALDAAADFVVLEPSRDTLGPESLRAVYVGGSVVRDANGPTPHSPGRWLGATSSAPGPN